MSVHGRSFLQYLNEDDDKWYPIPTSDLVSVDYTDKVYAPAAVELIVSNKRMNEVLGTDIDASSGTYTVEGEVANPTFRRYQTIRLFNLPRALELETITHDGASPAVFSKDAHGLTNGDFIHLVNEDSGTILDGIYEVNNVTTDTFRLEGPGEGSASQTYSTSAAGDGVTQAMLINTSGIDSSETEFAVDNVTGGGTPDTEVDVGAYVKVDDEVMQITDTSDTTISVTRGVLGSTAAMHDNNDAVNHQRTAYIAMRTDKMMYCYFYGKIDSVDVSYSDAVGKTIHIQASDYLRTLGTEPITKAIQDSSSACDDFTTTRLVPADEAEATDQGKFRDALYDNAKFSDTLKAIISDWAFGKSLYTDNTYDGSSSIGEAKFQDSDFSFATGDISRKKKFAGNNTTALKAMVSIAMTERHSNRGLEFPRTDVPAAEISYGSSGSEEDSGDDQDVLIKASSHGYVNGNMVNVSGDDLDGSSIDDDDYIHDGSYIVHSVTTDNFKIKGLDGNTITSTADSSTDRTVTIKAEPSGGQGYDFYLDTGLYGTTNGEAFAGHSQDTHRPHLNYFMRGSEPVDPEATGLTVYYPTSENQSESDTDWNMTKIFMQPDFDHGLFDDDLYTQVALSAVDDNGQVTNANDLGHVMEMFKVNSISNEDYTSDRVVIINQKQASGEECGAGVFHWNRGDDVRTYKWQSTDTNTYDELLEDNVMFFAGGAEGSNTNEYARKSMAHASKGTFGVIENNKGSFLNGGTTTGMAGFSPLPAGGRSITDPPNTTANDDGTYNDHPKMQDLVALTGTMEGFHWGATALAGANLIKDVYNCEVEGLLGTEVTATQATVSDDIKVNKEGHGLETGTLIRITNINGVTTGTTAGVKINTAPARTNGVNADTTDTGSYYRVEYEDEDYFWLTLPQKHRTNIDATSDRLAFSGTISGGTFKYKPVFNVFKEVCRVQWQSGFDWTTQEDLTVLRTSLTGKGAQSLMVSDVVKNDRPYKGLQVNTLLATPQYMPGNDHHGVIANHGTLASPSGYDNHPKDYYDASDTKSYFGYATVAQSLEADGTGDGCTSNVDRFGASVDDDVPVLFRYGDYISETRLLYGDPGLVGVVGRDRSSDAGGAAKTSNDVFKNVNCKIIERFKDKRSISKTYPLEYNTTSITNDWDSVRKAAAGLLMRTIIPAQRTTFNIFGYPTIKLVGQGQSGTSGDTLVPAQHPVSFGGRAGMLVEKLDGADAAGGKMTATSLATAIATDTGNITAPLDDGTSWAQATYYRFFIYLRAGSSIRVVHPAAGVTGNMIITGLKYSERAGHTRTSISTTGYDEAFINQMHAPLGQLIKSISSSSSSVQPTIMSNREITAIHKRTFDENNGVFYVGDPTS